MKQKVMYIIDDFDALLIKGLQNEGFEVVYAPNHQRSHILSNIGQADALFVRSKTNIDKELIDKAKNLKLIARGGAGMDNIDIEYAQLNNIYCINAPEGNRIAVAEHTLGLILALNNKIVSGTNEVRNFEWNREANRGEEIYGKTIAIIGYGNTGSELASRLQSFGCKIMVYDKYKKNFGNSNIIESSMKDIYNEADIVSFHIPLTPETKYLINKNYISNFKKNIVLINTSRGEIAKIDDLVTLLDEKKIKMMALDVLEDEKFFEKEKNIKDKYKNLVNRYNVIVTPHVAGWTKESYQKIAQVLLSKSLHYFQNFKKN